MADDKTVTQRRKLVGFVRDERSVMAAFIHHLTGSELKVVLTIRNLMNHGTGKSTVFIPGRERRRRVLQPCELVTSATELGENTGLARNTVITTLRKLRRFDWLTIESTAGHWGRSGTFISYDPAKASAWVGIVSGGVAVDICIQESSSESAGRSSGAKPAPQEGVVQGLDVSETSNDCTIGSADSAPKAVSELVISEHCPEQCPQNGSSDRTRVVLISQLPDAASGIIHKWMDDNDKANGAFEQWPTLLSAAIAFDKRDAVNLLAQLRDVDTGPGVRSKPKAMFGRIVKLNGKRPGDPAIAWAREQLNGSVNRKRSSPGAVGAILDDVALPGVIPPSAVASAGVEGSGGDAGPDGGPIGRSGDP